MQLDTRFEIRLPAATRRPVSLSRQTYDTAMPFASLTMKQACRSIFGKGARPCCLEFIFFKVHINCEFGGLPMPLTGAIPEGPSFFCPHCGALRRCFRCHVNEYTP
jgi:hypothetical protein